MKKTFGALLVAALMTVSANAAVTVTSTNVQSAASGGFAASGTTGTGTTLFDFDTTGALSGTSNGFTFANNNSTFIFIPQTDHANIVTGNQTNSSAPTNDTSKYLAVYAGGSETISNTATGYNTLSLYWGSPDNFNAIDLLDAAGTSIATLTGADVAGLSALSSTAGLVTINTSGLFYGAKFSSSTNAFELDNVRFSNTSAVPEPASWAMMIIGFGAVGFAVRRRQSGQTLPTLG